MSDRSPRAVLDFVSPLPPVRSGIADYSRDLLEPLSRHSDLRVVRVPGQEVGDDLVERWSPVDATRLGGSGRVPFYQMGNNRYHEEVLKLALEKPGLVTLHDVVLHHLLIESTLGKADHASYMAALEQQHGWIGELVARARWWGELSSSAVFELPAHRSLVRRQRGILVHSRWAAERILEEHPDVAVRTVPMGVPLPPPVRAADAIEFRRRHDLPLDRPILGSFGFQTPIKRTDVAIRALALPELAEAHLVIAGEVAGVLEYESLARDLEVTERVHVTGFLDYDEFETAIVACDLCLNLRYPTAGETSASLLRVLALGRPAVVSDYAQFAELPDDATLKVPLGDDEEKELARAVGELLAAPERLREMGRAARQMVEDRHDPDAAARAIAQACAELVGNDPPGEIAVDVPPPTTLLWQELPGELEVTGAAEPWVEGDGRELSIELTNTGVATWLATKEQPGGVILDLQWRAGLREEPIDRSWAELPTNLVAGKARRFRLELRRPRGANYLVIEPHIQNLAGMSRFGGPSWVGEYLS
ncbi:MAG: glycosyltransferase [Acidobacteriota bacterium]|nr:glycosyltransferase [Acidobacteriota bacterium]